MPGYETHSFTYGDKVYATNQVESDTKVTQVKYGNRWLPMTKNSDGTYSYTEKLSEAQG
jgi:hypothetical protein